MAGWIEHHPPEGLDQALPLSHEGIFHGSARRSARREACMWVVVSMGVLSAFALAGLKHRVDPPTTPMPSRSVAAPPAPLALAPSFPSSQQSNGSLGLRTAEGVLLSQEIARARSFFGRLALLMALAAVGFPWARGDATAKVVCEVSLVAVAALAAWTSWSLRDRHWYSTRRVASVAILSIASGLCLIYYTGVLSCAALGMVFAPLFVGLGPNPRVALGMYLGCAIGYALLVAGVLTGVMPEVGVIASVQPDAPVRVVGPLLVEVVLLGAFLNTRRERAVAIATIAQQVEAARTMAQREGLLQEARQELERALNFEGLGRFSDASVGSFHLGKVIGRGAMGEVYEAVHAVNGARAAVKLLHIDGLSSPDMVKRFLREAQIAASLDVPNVVRVVEVGDLTSPLPYIAMERLVGEDLADYLRRHGRMSFEQVVTLVREVGAGLEAARAAGIVHRDLKPRNIFLEQYGGAKILDFGVSKLANTERTLTQDRVVGTPGYMAPEQAMGKEVTHSADLFSLGVIAYRALTGRPAFAGDHVGEIFYKLTKAMPPRPSEIVRVNPQVDLVIAIAIAKNMGDRFDSGCEFANALEAARAGRLSRGLVVHAQQLLADLPWSRIDLGAVGEEG